MVFSNYKISPKCKITLDDEELQQVESFNYPGSVLTQDCRCTSDIKTPIALAKKSLTDMSSTFTNKQLENDTKKRLMKCYIWSSYGCESRTLNKRDESRLEAMGIVDLPSHEKNFMERLENKQRSSGNDGRGTEIVKNYSSETTEIRRAQR